MEGIIRADTSVIIHIVDVEAELSLLSDALACECVNSLAVFFHVTLWCKVECLHDFLDDLFGVAFLQILDDLLSTDFDVLNSQFAIFVVMHDLLVDLLEIRVFAIDLLLLIVILVEL